MAIIKKEILREIRSTLVMQYQKDFGMISWTFQNQEDFANYVFPIIETSLSKIVDTIKNETNNKV